MSKSTKKKQEAVEQQEIPEITQQEYIEKYMEHLQAPIEKVDSGLKEVVVNYVGEKMKPENDEVSLEMVIETFANEFPDFLMPIAEENFIRGYSQAMMDVENPDFMKNIMAATGKKAE